MGRLRKYRERTGKTLVVEMPEDTYEALERACDIMDDGMVDAGVVMHELKIGKKTLANMICCGKITADMYCTAVNGVKKFDLKKILGIRNEQL